MASRTLNATDPEAKPYEDQRKEIEEHTRRVKAKRKPQKARPTAKSEEQQ